MQIKSFCDIRQLIDAVQNLEDLAKEEFGLSLNEAYTLCLLTKQEPLSPSNLVQELKVTPSRVSRIIEHLESLGYLSIQLGRKDSRTREIRLTEKGAAFSCSIADFENKQFPITIKRS